jgi:integrase
LGWKGVFTRFLWGVILQLPVKVNVPHDTPAIPQIRSRAVRDWNHRIGGPMTTSSEFEFLRPKDRERLNYRQAVVYQDLLEEYIEWLSTTGKNPNKGEGYSDETVTRRLTSIRQIIYWALENEETSLSLTEAEADAFVDALADDEYRCNDGQPYGTNAKRKFNDTLRSWFRWQNGGIDESVWEPNIEFNDRIPANPADPFSKDERPQIYDASLTYKTTPEYGNLSPTERDRRKATIVQELGKSKEDVIPKDFEQINRCWKIPSLISSTLDLGFRPCEIGRAVIDWLRLDKQEVHIPPEDAAKNREHWKIPIRERTARDLQLWCEQRDEREKYDGCDEIWLNRKGNPYTSANLNYLLRNLLDEADINYDDRKLVWYSFRHSTGQYIYDASDQMTTAAVLRHKDKRSVTRYAGPTPEQIRQAQRDALLIPGSFW